jgi:hypothetical protein
MTAPSPSFSVTTKTSWQTRSCRKALRRSWRDKFASFDYRISFLNKPLRQLDLRDKASYGFRSSMDIFASSISFSYKTAPISTPSPARFRRRIPGPPQVYSPASLTGQAPAKPPRQLVSLDNAPHGSRSSRKDDVARFS